VVAQKVSRTRGEGTPATIPCASQRFARPNWAIGSREYSAHDVAFIAILSPYPPEKSMSLNKTLEHLKHSRDLFEALSAGMHLDASQNIDWHKFSSL